MTAFSPAYILTSVANCFRLLKETKMSKRSYELARGFAKVGLVIVMTVIAAATTANAQTLEYKLTANIPFDFVVADQQLPAGEYSFRRSELGDGDQVIEISRRGGKTVISRITIPVTTATPNKSGRVTFHRSGEQYFLSEIWPANTTTGRALPKSF
jgi:hypothetical protein